MMQPINVEPTIKRKKGGGLFGKILGGLAGGVAAVATGGAALPAIGAGMSLGGMAGEAVAPGSIEQKGTPGGIALVADQDNEVQLSRLVDAQKELTRSTMIPEPEKPTYMDALTQAQQVIKKRMGLI